MRGGMYSWRFIVLFFIFAQTLTGCGGVKVGCLVLGGGHSAEKGADTSRFQTLGEQVWQLLRDGAEQSDTNAAEKVAVWEKNKAKFITAFDTFLPTQETKLLKHTAGEVYQFIDDDTIPRMTDAFASTIEILYTNSEDPDKRALKGLHALLKPQNATLDPEVFLEFLGRLTAHKELQDFIASIGEVVRENDGVDETGEPNGEKDLITDLFTAIGERLEEANVQGGATNNFKGMVEHLLDTRNPSSTVDLGEPAWVVELDTNNNPVVAVDPNTGDLYLPFVDVDLDGLADSNSDGNHIDTNGDEIEIPAFASDDGYRDTYNRALCAEGGDPLYLYFDAKRTALAGLLMFAGDLLEEDLPRKLRPVADAIMGQEAINDNGTPGDPDDDYSHYPAENNPLLDLLWSMLELTRAEEVSNLTGNMGGVAISERHIAERLVLYTGKILKAFQEEEILKEYDDWIKILDLVDDLLPIVDEIFEKSNASAQSTGEIIMEVMKDLSEGDEDVDNQFGLMIQYRNLVYDETPQGKVLNTSESIPVDYTQPMYFGNVDNRSVVDRTIHLVVLLDGPNLPFSSKNLADVALESMADGSGTSGFMGFLLGAANVPLIEAIGVPILNLLGYPGQEVWNEIEVYDSLTASGSTEGFSTVLKVFADQGQMDLVKDIFHILETDLQRDLNNDPDTFSMIRKSEPALADILQSTIMNDFTTLLNTIEEANAINNGSGSTNNYAEIADLIAYLIDDDVTLNHRDGTPAKSRLHWLTRPLRSMLLRVETAGEFENMTGAMKSFLNLITEAVWNDNGTPLDTTDDFEELARPGLALVLKAVNTYSGQGSAAQTQQEIDEFVADQQLNLINDLTGKALPSFIELWKAIDESETSAGFYGALRNLLRPYTGEIYKDVFASLITILGQTLESEIQNEYEADLNGYLALVLTDHNGYIVEIIFGLEAIASAGVELSVLDLLSNLLWKGDEGTLVSPAEDFLDIIRELDEIETGEGNEETFTVEDLEESLKNLVNFARDDAKAGLPAFYDIIKKRDK